MRLPVLVAAAVLAVLCFGLGWALGQQRAAPEPVAGAGAAARAALAEGEPIPRLAGLLPVLQGLRGDQIDEVGGAFEEVFGTGVIREPSYTLLMEALVAIDPQAALEFILGWPLDALHAGLSPLMRAWARGDPQAARAAVARLEDFRMRKAAGSGLLHGWAESGDPGVWSYVAVMDPGLDREGASKVLMRAVARREGPAALLEMVEDLPDDAPGAFKQAAFRTAASLVVRMDPERATAFTERHAGGEYDKNLIARVGAAWAFLDGPAALKWVYSLPEGKERDLALAETLRRWIRQDREPAFEWMRERRGDPSLAPALETYALAEARDDQLPTLTWLLEIPDSELRTRLLLTLGKWWLQREPEAAQPWLESQGLYAEIAETIERNPRKPRGRAARRGPSPAAASAPQPPPF